MLAPSASVSCVGSIRAGVAETNLPLAGCASLKDCADTTIAYNVESRLGFCGEVYGGQRIPGAVRSGQCLAAHFLAAPDVSVLPTTAEE